MKEAANVNRAIQMGGRYKASRPRAGGSTVACMKNSHRSLKRKKKKVLAIYIYRRLMYWGEFACTRKILHCQVVENISVIKLVFVY